MIILAESFSELPQGIFELEAAEKRPLMGEYIIRVRLKRQLKYSIEDGMEKMSCSEGCLTRIHGSSGPWRWQQR